MQEKNTQNVIYFLTRLKSILKISTDIELANILNVNNNVISNWKKRNTLDYDAIINLCIDKNIDLNKIFTNREYNIHVANKNENCTLCEEKERIIASKEETIEALKKTVKQLEKNLEFYESPNKNGNKKTA